MSEIPCEQPFEDGTHCQEPRGHHLTAATAGRCGHGVNPERCAMCRETETEENL